MFKPASILLVLAITFLSHSVQATPLSGEAKIIDPNGFTAFTFPITGDLDLDNNTMEVDPFLFFGSDFFTNSIELLAEGTYTRQDVNNGTDMTATVGPGQLGAWMVFEWNANLFSSFMVWDVTTHSNGQAYTTIDSDENGAAGHAFVGGPFPGFAIVYDYLVGEPPPGIEITIAVEGGPIQECSETGGSTVTMSAEVELLGGTELAGIEWFVNGESAGTDPGISPFLGLGVHPVEAIASTTTGESDSDSVPVTVIDTSRPEIDVSFVDSQTGETIDQIADNRTRFVTTRIVATDICDPAPSTRGSITPVHEVSDGDTIRIQGNNQQVSLPVTALELSATARDASGNARSGQTLLTIAD